MLEYIPFLPPALPSYPPSKPSHVLSTLFSWWPPFKNDYCYMHVCLLCVCITNTYKHDLLNLFLLCVYGFKADYSTLSSQYGAHLPQQWLVAVVLYLGVKLCKISPFMLTCFLALLLFWSCLQLFLGQTVPRTLPWASSLHIVPYNLHPYCHVPWAEMQELWCRCISWGWAPLHLLISVMSDCSFLWWSSFAFLFSLVS